MEEKDSLARTDKPANTQLTKMATEAEKNTANRNKFAKLNNLLDGKMYVDVLHKKCLEEVPCTPERCMGSQYAHTTKRPPGVPRPKEELIVHAKDFIDQYYQSIKKLNTPAHLKRMEEVMSSIESTGTYDLTTHELTFGAKTAWRNASRCIGRIQWSKLQMFDARHVRTAKEMFDAICKHVKYAMNNGNLRSSITVFPKRTDPKDDFRIWNTQLIRYAGYRQPDGSVIGDPVNCDFTEVCINMGWTPKGRMFDILPLVISAEGHDPEMFEVPPELTFEVSIKHPKFPWCADLGLKWVGVPFLTSMMFDCGGIEFPAAPFNGWFLQSEVARDLCDTNRYNILETVAKMMGLDTRKISSLWKDQAFVEVNIAVLYSYQSAGITMTDHHTGSDSFIKHMENEQRLRGGCPADWVWIVPPIGGSLTRVFYQEMIRYNLKPSYDYQVDAWRTHVWEKDRDKAGNAVKKPSNKRRFKEVARVVAFSTMMMRKALMTRVKCLILYATETGKSEGFARSTCDIFLHAFDAKMMCMEEYDIAQLENEGLVLIITSTFGNGDPPDQGESFSQELAKLTNDDTPDENENVERGQSEQDDNNSLLMTPGPFGNVRYSVFALGSRAYPNFCAFGQYVDKTLHLLGAERILSLGEGDELCGQEESFRNWAQEVFKTTCDTFCLTDDIDMSAAIGALTRPDINWSSSKFRTTELDEKELDVCEGLSKLHSKSVVPCKLVERIQLQSAESSRQTILAKLDNGGAVELLYQAGDRVGIYPTNPLGLVDAILARLDDAPTPGQVIQVEFLQKTITPLGTTTKWIPYDKRPKCSLRRALGHYLDITTTPSQSFLKLLATQASRDDDREILEQLSTVSRLYEEWKYKKTLNLLDVLNQFPSLKVPPSLIMTQLPLLQQRFYSISSSSLVTPDQIHATIAVVRYRTQDGSGPIRKGVCSGWLNSCDIGETVPCTLRVAPNFRMPEDVTLPVYLISSGSGIAPLRSFWQQRKINKETLLTQSADGETWGEMKLYFGCRNPAEDFIYETELRQMKAEGILTGCYIAFSRRQGQPKVYVQDILLQMSADVYSGIVKRGGHFYVCGSIEMASDVMATLEKILQKEGGMSVKSAKKYIQDLETANRFHKDIFGTSIERNLQTAMRAGEQINGTTHIINVTDETVKQNSLNTPVSNQIKTTTAPTSVKDRQDVTRNIEEKQRKRKKTSSPCVII
ncbi:nitric oxide synthase, brain-like [Gigantopelta aegis]|uniref:nitric oxide synthase, brain-like n=1 Tax=Gigantopelta aegis TaxID=1735272 RepID=UPI001B88D6B4|nr:nitric oxide synthase, brain-like [Gigantopelta aegis]